MHGDMAALAIRFSRGATKYDNCPAQCEAADFDAFMDAVLGDRASAKGKAYVCASMAEGCHNEPEKYPGMATWRLKRLAQPRCFLPLDIDGFDTPETFTQLRELLDRFQGFAYTTASHTPDAPRCRVVLAQSRETNQEDGTALCLAVQAMIEAELGADRVKFDKSVYKAEQPLYTPPIGAETFRFAGSPVDVDAVLVQGSPKKPEALRLSKYRLELVKTEDQILNTLNVLGMVRADKGHGAYHIECPFSDQHTSFTGDGETIYYLPHTNGFAMAHFHCLHQHCEKRSDIDFMLELQTRHMKQCGKPPPFAMDDTPVPTRKSSGGDAELSWLLDNAPLVIRSYVDWYMDNAIRPHPVFALVSALLFIQAVIGRNVTMPRGTRPNLWMMLLAPTESGKGDVPRLATNGLEQISASRVFPAIPQFDEAFGSAEGLWWHLEQCTQVVWADEELAKTLAAVIAAPEGSPRYALRRALLVLYDAATRAQVAPIRYSRRTTSGREMQPLRNPFLSVVGTGVPRDIGSFTAAAADDGLLNRFLVVVVEDLPAVGSIRPTTALPAEVMNWAGKLHMTGVLEAMAQAANGPRELGTYTGLDTDWAAEMEHGSALAQGLPGVWGRYAEKILKVAMLFAVADSGVVTPEAFEWGKRFVRWANSNFARHFEAEGGGAENELDAMAQAFMATFDVPALAGRDSLSTKLFAQYGGRAWRNCKDSLKRRRVVEALIEDGRIEEIPLQPRGVAYRKLG